GRPLTDFPVLAFSISYELDYFNVATMLRAANIPLFAADRDESHPLVIAGGPCITANPMPVAPFFDCLGIGEAEPLLPPMLPVLREGLGGERHELLKALAKIPGLYVPACPPEQPVVRQFAPDLDLFSTTSVIMTPDTELGELFLIEAERGCQRGCRFCLVNGAFSPMRFRSADTIIQQAREGTKYRNRTGLVGPAVTDHPEITDILDGLNRLGTEISISSLRISSLSGDIIAGLARGKAQTITIAPEAGSERLRGVIRKGITEDDILKTADDVAANGFRQLKMYFIAGLPTETDEDIEEIIRLSLAVKERLDRGVGTRITLNVAPFVPKAGTPFQWLPMAPQDILNNRLTMLRSALPLKGVKVNEESPAWSHVQGALARGDEKLADVIAGIEDVTLAGWRNAVEKYKLDLDHYVNQQWDTAEPLPWSVVSGSSDPARLCAEMEKALKEGTNA
ncbi:MAG: radical SAM protein, partial [Dehalococcoidales bacterium]|nr:radical SAM protein [Dehalococcoidales bacterium]